MEDNVSDALKMGFGMLMFVISLTIAISSFSNARKAAQAILELNDREFDYTYVDNISKTERYVGAETVIPTVYRSSYENYKIFFVDKNEQKISLYIREGKDGTPVHVNYIDLQSMGEEATASEAINSIGGKEEQKKFLEAIIYGEDILDATWKKFFQDKKIRFFTKGANSGIITLCDIIFKDGTKFEEFLGEYYRQDLKEPASELESVPDSNKEKKRVITYKLEN